MCLLNRQDALLRFKRGTREQASALRAMPRHMMAWRFTRRPRDGAPLFTSNICARARRLLPPAARAPPPRHIRYRMPHEP